MPETNGQFVERMLDKIVERAVQSYTDPMWYIIALKIRHEGKPWSEMNKYAEKAKK